MMPSPSYVTSNPLYAGLIFSLTLAAMGVASGPLSRSRTFYPVWRSHSRTLR